MNRLTPAFFIRALIVVTGLILIGQAARLQFSARYADRANATATGTTTLYPSRGLITDRNGRLLTTNDPVYDLMVIYRQVDRENMDIDAFCALLDLDRAEFDRRLEKDFRNDVRYSTRLPFVFLDKVSDQTHARMQEHMHRFPGFQFQIRDVRKYPYRAAAHVLGYIREVNAREVASADYVPGDYIGGTGLEREYEARMRGRKGVRYTLRDRGGNELGAYEGGKDDILPQTGANIQTGLDAELQLYGEQLMRNKIGAVVAIEPGTGEILSMISAPTYDPNAMTITRERGRVAQQLSTDSLKPFFNRAVSAEYPPGSIFKPIVALIAQQEGVRRPDEVLRCPGYYQYKNLRVRCRNHPGPNDLANSIQWSCNNYYCRTFRDIVDKKSFNEPKVGYSIFTDYLYRFGLGNPLEVDFPIESNGNVPTVSYYDKLYPRDRGSWRSPTILSLAIGQGEIQMTTLQIANVAAILANRGWYVRPHLVRGFGDGTPIDEKYRERLGVRVQEPHFDPVIQGMIDVVERGTGRRARLPNGPLVAGKTGTVQNPHGENHSTFIAFAPADDPKIAIAVYVENAGGGGRFAAPIAGLMLEKYLTGQISEARTDQEQQVMETNLIAP